MNLIYLSGVEQSRKAHTRKGKEVKNIIKQDLAVYFTAIQRMGKERRQIN
jgi:hypothetical protein